MAWDQLLPLAIMISVVIVLLLFMRRRLEADSRRPERARTLCAELGFNFIAGHDARFRNQGAPAMPMDLAALDRLPASLRSSLIEDSSWRGEGVFGKARIAVYDDVRPTGNRFQTFLVVRGYFRDGPVEPFRIERKGGLALLLSKKPSTGNVFFDRKLRVEGGEASAVRRALSNDAFLKASEALFVASRRARIDEEGACWEKKDAPLDIASLTETMRLVSDAVLAFPVSGR
ncbi:MAG: hypothetical protein CVV47_07655 [Spirochaetae bacterium HGW-Spirochaetae-3]|jgi:hypothetical protein|nr:MAG: hypothetical protein CVV47_07655 [Spirochaetae bacterium HGW-Spirochaetae-3]